ncbi:hypothetical protein RchiOBHm_Chr4g0428241 [Rosa chinensis]|uniref:Uncharacterized protein n=1 Tax=Rosa chinensis TaxID=74649 RepID=A0A2P6QZW0_ROSCH|nr:hypothetical protein RchiOBHm_Chr4g0428241 [Rosa chinensis]
MSLFHFISPCACPISHQISRSILKPPILLHLRHLTLSSSSDFSLFPQPHLHFQPLESRQGSVHLTSHLLNAAVPASHCSVWTSPDQWCCDAWWSPPPRLPLLSSLFFLFLPVHAISVWRMMVESYLAFGSQASVGAHLAMVVLTAASLCCSEDFGFRSRFSGILGFWASACQLVLV